MVSSWLCCGSDYVVSDANLDAHWVAARGTGDVVGSWKTQAAGVISMTSPAQLQPLCLARLPDPWALPSRPPHPQPCPATSWKPSPTPRVAKNHSLVLQVLDGIRKWESPGLREEKQEDEAGHDGDDTVGDGGQQGHGLASHPD